MRICVMCQEDIVTPQGGTGTYARNVSAALTGRGHEVHVICRRQRGMAAFEEANGVRVHRVSAPGLPVLYNPVFFRQSRRQFAALHGAARFDVIVGNLPLMSSSGLRGDGLPPIVEVVHCTVEEELKAVAGTRHKHLNLNEVAVQAIAPVWRRRESHLLRRARRLICVSAGLKRELVGQGHSASNAEVVPNGVQYERFAAVWGADDSGLRRSLGIAPGAPVILYLGRLMERKRVIDLVDMLPYVLDCVPQAHLVIVGKQNQNADLLRDRAIRLGVRERVTLVDHVPYAEVPAYYSMASVYCLPSSYEGFPFTILEAMASGTPVVASRIKGIDEQIEDDVTGQMHAVGDVDGIARCVIRALTDPAFVARTTETAAEIVRRQYDWEVLGEQTERVLAGASA